MKPKKDEFVQQRHNDSKTRNKKLSLCREVARRSMSFENCAVNYIGHMTTDSYSCYAASNSIFMNASDQDQLLEVYLQECYCLSLLTYCHGALSLNKAQLSDLNVRWNNLDRKLFHFHQWESVHVFINGIGKLHFLHLSKLIAAKFFKHLCGSLVLCCGNL